MVTGPPGAGKSTVARLLVEAFPTSALVQGDAFFTFVRGGWIEPWMREAHGQNETVIAASAAATGRFAAGGYSVVYDGVIGPWFLPAFTRATGVREVEYVVLLPPEDVCLARVATRVGHGFTDADAARRMHREFATAEVQERHVLRDADGKPADVAAEILERRARGQLRYAP